MTTAKISARPLPVLFHQKRANAPLAMLTGNLHQERVARLIGPVMVAAVESQPQAIQFGKAIHTPTALPDHFAGEQRALLNDLRKCTGPRVARHTVHNVSSMQSQSCSLGSVPHVTGFTACQRNGQVLAPAL